VPRSTFYRWKKVFAEECDAGLIRKRPVARKHSKQVSPEAVEKILYLRQTYQLGPQRIVWYMERYHGIVVLVPAFTGSWRAMK
jgi:hypothetical protein